MSETSVKWRGREFERKLYKHLRRNMEAAAIIVQTQAKNNVRSGGPSGLHVRSRNLLGSIAYEVRGNFTARVGSNLVYARIHELGGEIVPKTKEYLHFEIDGHHVMTKHVHIPARPYLRPAMDSTSKRWVAAASKKMPETL